MSNLDDPFKQTFHEHYARILHHLVRLVGRRDEAEDLTQQVFLKLHEHFEQVEPHKTKAWLYRVATHLGLNALRGQRRFDHLKTRSRDESSANNSVPHPEALTLQRAEQQRVQSTLARLNERDAHLLFLFFTGQQNYKEIAEQLQVQPGSVGTLLARAKKAFKKEYEALALSKGEDRVL